MIVSYDHDQETTRNLCSYCAVRVLWGGDRTVSSLRQVPLPPLATELAFPDRFSVAAFHAQAVNQATDQQLGTLIHKFFADTFSFDQMACSSPRLVYQHPHTFHGTLLAFVVSGVGKNAQGSKMTCPRFSLPARQNGLNRCRRDHRRDQRWDQTGLSHVHGKPFPRSHGGSIPNLNSRAKTLRPRRLRNLVCS